MQKPERTVRVYRFLDLVAFSTENTPNMYFTVEHAERIATELRRFTRCLRKGVKFHPATRLVTEGKAVNESNGKVKPYMLP